MIRHFYLLFVAITALMSVPSIVSAHGGGHNAQESHDEHNHNEPDEHVLTEQEAHGQETLRTPPIVLGYHAVRSDEHWEHSLLTGILFEQSLDSGDLGAMLGVNWSPLPGPSVWLWYSLPEGELTVQFLATFDGHWNREIEQLEVHGGLFMGPSFRSTSLNLGVMYWSEHRHDQLLREHPVDTEDDYVDHQLPALLAGPGLMLELLPSPHVSLHIEGAVNAIDAPNVFKEHPQAEDGAQQSWPAPVFFLGIGAEWYF